MWEIRVPVLSTGHVTKETNDWLLRELNERKLFGAEYEEGYFLYLDDEENCDGRKDLLAIRQYLIDKGYDEYGWVRLDRDGDQVDELPVYDW